MRADRRAFPGDELREESFRAVRRGGAALILGLGSLAASAAWGVAAVVRGVVRIAVGA